MCQVQSRYFDESENTLHGAASKGGIQMIAQGEGGGGERDEGGDFDGRGEVR